jgi:hypothetical protein
MKVSICLVYLYLQEIVNFVTNEVIASSGYDPSMENGIQNILTKVNQIPANPLLTNDTRLDTLIQGISDIKNLTNDILDIHYGNWEILNNQMVFYDRDNIEIMRFNLKDKSGNASEVSIYKREKV